VAEVARLMVPEGEGKVARVLEQFPFKIGRLPEKECAPYTFGQGGGGGGEERPVVVVEQGTVRLPIEPDRSPDHEKANLALQIEDRRLGIAAPAAGGKSLPQRTHQRT